MTTTPTPDYKIVIFSGQEFSVPTTTSEKEIRDALVAQGFADVASAEAKKGKRTVDGAEVATIEFVKRAGVKG